MVSHFGSYSQTLLNNEIQSIYIHHSGINISDHHVNWLSSITSARFKGGQVGIKPQRLATGESMHVPEGVQTDYIASEFQFAIYTAQNIHTREGRCWSETEGSGSLKKRKQDATDERIVDCSSPSATLQQIVNI
jgi:hypothetical protein